MTYLGRRVPVSRPRPRLPSHVRVRVHALLFALDPERARARGTHEGQLITYIRRPSDAPRNILEVDRSHVASMPKTPQCRSFAHGDGTENPAMPIVRTGFVDVKITQPCFNLPATFRLGILCKGQLGQLGAFALRRGFPRTHRFAQARAVFAVASFRCAEVFDPSGCVTLFRLSESIEEDFDARWEHWLDNAAAWMPFFEQSGAELRIGFASNSLTSGGLTFGGIQAQRNVALRRDAGRTAQRSEDHRASVGKYTPI